MLKKDYVKNILFKSILHVNVESPFKDFDTAWNALNYIFSQGVTYFAFTGRIRSCERNHGFYGETCPECGGHWVTEWARIVGFWTPIASWSDDRCKEFAKREWKDFNEESNN